MTSIAKQTQENGYPMKPSDSAQELLEQLWIVIQEEGKPGLGI
jgi:hypothetical protein